MFSRTDISSIRVRLVVIRLVSVLITNQGKAWKASAQCQLLRLAVEGFLPSPRTGLFSRVWRCTLEHFGRCCVFPWVAAR